MTSISYNEVEEGVAQPPDQVVEGEQHPGALAHRGARPAPLGGAGPLDGPVDVVGAQAERLEGGAHVLDAVDRQVDGPGAPVVAAPLLNGLPHGGVVDDREQLGQVVDEEAEVKHPATIARPEQRSLSFFLFFHKNIRATATTAVDTTTNRSCCPLNELNAAPSFRTYVKEKKSLITLMLCPSVSIVLIAIFAIWSMNIIAAVNKKYIILNFRSELFLRGCA